MNVYTYTHVRIVVYIHIYIYIERERERGSTRPSLHLKCDKKLTQLYPSQTFDLHYADGSHLRGFTGVDQVQTLSLCVLDVASGLVTGPLFVHANMSFVMPNAQ